MTVAVGVLGVHGAAIASDSVHVDLTTQVVSSRPKIIRARGWIGALAGISDIDGHEFLVALGAAMGRANRIEDIADQFLSEVGTNLTTAYERLHSQLGLSPEKFPTELLVVGRTGNDLEMASFWTVVNRGHLSMDGNVDTPRRDRTVCEAIGSHDPIVLRTNQARLQPHMRIDASDLPPLDSVTKLRDLAVGLADEVIAAEASLARPSTWPAGVPVLAAPIQVDVVGAR